jgi:hypothetical protein
MFGRNGAGIVLLSSGIGKPSDLICGKLNKDGRQIIAD